MKMALINDLRGIAKHKRTLFSLRLCECVKCIQCLSHVLQEEYTVNFCNEQSQIYKCSVVLMRGSSVDRTNIICYQNNQ